MFRNAELTDRYFSASDLRRSDFAHAEITNCNFSECQLNKADFLGAIFTNCDFSNSVLDEAYIVGAQFHGCNFMGASFVGTYMFSSQFKNCDLTAATMQKILLSTVDFTGTSFANVEWEGTFINSPPLLVQGIEYPIVALDNGYMHVGCEFNTYDWFWNTDEKQSAQMEGLRARRFWKRNKQWIFDMLKARKLYTAHKCDVDSAIEN